MNFFFGQKKDEKKVTNQIAAKLKQALKAQFCQFCQKAPATKVAFANEQKNGFTCNNCELKAVGGDVKNLGQKSLIGLDKFVDILTKHLISHQTSQVEPCEQVKETQNNSKAISKSSIQISELLKNQISTLKKLSDSKMQQLVRESEKQNSVFIFEQLNRILAEKKPSLEQIKSLVGKRALVDKKGLHFINEEAIETSNGQLDQKYSILKKQTKVKLKELDDLSEWINGIEL